MTAARFAEEQDNEEPAATPVAAPEIDIARLRDMANGCIGSGYDIWLSHLHAALTPAVVLALLRVADAAEVVCKNAHEPDALLNSVYQLELAIKDSK